VLEANGIKTSRNGIETENGVSSFHPFSENEFRLAIEKNVDLFEWCPEHTVRLSSNRTLLAVSTPAKVSGTKREVNRGQSFMSPTPFLSPLFGGSQPSGGNS